MILLRARLTYEEVQLRFEKEGYRLLSKEYLNARCNMPVLCPFGHEWTTNMSNFDFGRRCSICSRRKKYALEEVKSIFAKQGYLVQDSIYMNGKTPIKVSCSKGHETAISLNNFMNGRQCSVCGRRKAFEARMKKLEAKANSKEVVLRREASHPLVVTNKTANESADQIKPESLAKLDEKIAQITSQTLIIGVDIAKYKHVARARDFRGQEFRKAFHFENTYSDFNHFLGWIQ